jgi:uncharacterized protein GlcG (DUF336 family)
MYPGDLGHARARLHRQLHDLTLLRYRPPLANSTPWTDILRMHHEGIITPKVLNSPEGNSGRLRIDNTWLGSIDISVKKAYTSRAFDIETKALASYSQPGGQFFGIRASNDGKVMIVAGGIPLKRDGKVVEAIGVSGGSGDQDLSVTMAGAAAF